MKLLEHAAAALRVRPDQLDTRRARFCRLGVLALLLAVLIVAIHATTVAIRMPELSALRGLTDGVSGRETAFHDEIASLQERIQMLETEVAIVRGANRQLMLMEDLHQDDLAQIRGELEFFNRLALAGGRQSGLAIHSLEIHPDIVTNRWRFALALVQQLQNAQNVTGRIQVQIEGISNTGAHTLDWSRIRLPGTPEVLNFEFKYFSQVTGRFGLPAGFQPLQAHIVLEPAGDTAGTVSRSFEWTAVTHGGIEDEPR